ncbi:MAG: xanthine dehydrogenase family protein subunit M [Thermoleophilia bacterium]|nr:xanthine dehydrogenase family protein subunit M [Thermoleophilia bacterium]
MIPAPFDYEVAETPEHAIELLCEREDAKLLAGGHSLLPAMRLRLARPRCLVDVGRLSDLSYVRDEGDEIAIGALTRHKDVAGSEVLRERCPIVAATAAQVGDPQVRHRGTIGGSLAHGDPASDLPAVALALGGTLVARGSGGDRRIPASDFFTGVFETALALDEMLVEVRVPALGAGRGWAFEKMSRRAQDWATVAVAAVVERANGSLARASVALVNMGGTPLRAAAVEEAIAGGASIEEAAALAAEGTEPPSDHAASADFRRHLARVLTRRALERATAR